MRRIPFEVMVKGDKVPFYEETLEDAGRFTDQPVLPFNAYGTMALARGEFEANSGSSQVFWLLKAPQLPHAFTPACLTANMCCTWLTLLQWQPPLQENGNSAGYVGPGISLAIFAMECAHCKHA